MGTSLHFSDFPTNREFVLTRAKDSRYLLSESRNRRTFSATMQKVKSPI